MTTVKADDRRRVQIPSAKPGQVFALENQGNGRILLTVVVKTDKEPFPPDYDFGLDKAQNRELLALAKGSSLEVPK